MRIAALDDEAVQLDLIRHTMEGIGHECHGFSDGKTLLRDLRQQTYDLLILDWTLPDVQGPRVVRWIREDLNSRIPILFVTNRREEKPLANVLSNALKYSPSGADLECRVQEDERNWRVAFRDHGPGIPVELQSQLFQPFHRLNHEAHPEVHGVGLGLLLVRTVVQRHGGSVEIDSAEGAGCIVTLVLPKPTSVEREALVSHEES